MNSQQYREHLFDKMTSSHKEIKRLKKQLLQKRFQRVFKNTSCVTAIKIHKTKVALKGCIESSEMAMQEAWMALPEVKDRPFDVHEMLAFVAVLSKRPRRRKFMKNQRALQLE
mgnify:CR=1 FL=1